MTLEIKTTGSFDMIHYEPFNYLAIHDNFTTKFNKCGEVNIIFNVDEIEYPLYFNVNLMPSELEESLLEEIESIERDIREK